MKPSILLALLTSFLFASARADEPITREEAATLKSYDLDKLEAIIVQLENKVVRLKFNYRRPDVDRTKDGVVGGTLAFWRYSTAAAGSTYKSGFMDVVVPPAGMEWFMKLPTTESRASLFVIARIHKDEDGHYAHILGREVKTDLKGSRVVW